MGRNGPITRTFEPIGQGFKPKPRTRGLGDEGTTHMLVIALDYKGTSNPLTCSIDAKNMIALAQASGITSIKALWDNQCTKQNVLQQLVNVANICKPGDTFLFYYTGHGTSVKDLDGDEVDYKDEAYVCVTSSGQIDPNEFLTDDEFAAHLLEYVNKECNMIIISDCCHSGTMCDFGKPRWEGYHAISISGCRDSQTSGDTGKGGICTHSMLMAIEAFQKKGKNRYSVGDLYRATLSFDDQKFASPQDIYLDTAPQCSSNNIDWPLVPKGPFQAPYNLPGGLHPLAQRISTSESNFGVTLSAGGSATPGAPAATAPQSVAYSNSGIASSNQPIQSFLPPLPTYVPQSIIQPHKPAALNSFSSFQALSGLSGGYPSGATATGAYSPTAGGLGSFSSLYGPSSYLSLLNSLASPMSREVAVTPTYPGMAQPVSREVAFAPAYASVAAPVASYVTGVGQPVAGQAVVGQPVTREVSLTPGYPGMAPMAQAVSYAQPVSYTMPVGTQREIVLPSPATSYALPAGTTTFAGGPVYYT